MIQNIIDLGSNAGMFNSHEGFLIQQRDDSVTIRIRNMSRLERYHAWQTGDHIEIARFANNTMNGSIHIYYESPQILADQVCVVLNMPRGEHRHNNITPLSAFPRLASLIDEREVPGRAIYTEMFARLAEQIASNNLAWSRNENWASGEIVRRQIEHETTRHAHESIDMPQRLRVSHDMPDATSRNNQREAMEWVRSYTFTIPPEYQAVLEGAIPITPSPQRLENLFGGSSGARGGGDGPVSGGRLPEHERLDEHYQMQEEHEMLDAKLQPQEENEDEKKEDYSDTTEVDDLIETMKGLIEEGDEDE